MMAWVLTYEQYCALLEGEIVTRAYRGSYPRGPITVCAIGEDAKWLPEVKAFAMVDDVEKIGSGNVRHHYRFHIVFQKEGDS